MKNNIEKFPGISILDFNPDILLEDSLGIYDSVLIIGFDKEGNLRIQSSMADGADVLWLLKRTEYLLMKKTDELENEK